MQPDTPRADGFKPKYRQFKMLDRVWVTNPFDHDVVFQVADEMNRPFKYRLRANQVSELPGGAIATLGVKAIVDELIQNDQKDAMLLWDENVRAKHEATIIMRIKETKPLADSVVAGEIDLSVQGNTTVDEAPTPEAPAEEAFPGLNQPLTAEPLETPKPKRVPKGLKDNLDSMVSASLPSSNAVLADE